MLSGDWQLAFTYHLFSPFLLIALTLIGIGAIAPPKLAHSLSFFVEQWERRTGLTSLALIALVGYWLIRLIIFQKPFFALIYGS